jgi:Fe-S-cluster containining protein
LCEPGVGCISIGQDSLGGFTKGDGVKGEKKAGNSGKERRKRKHASSGAEEAPARTRAKETTIAVCSECPSLCCKNLSMMIYRPQNRAEIEDLKWQLQFDTVRVYIRNHRWYQLIEGKCMYLGDDGRCIQYEDRPDKCRIHKPPDCEFYGPFYDIMISTPDELDEYLGSKRGKRGKPAQALKRAA